MAISLRDPQDGDLAEISDINVTPFIDVILVLLIIFMVAAPLSTVDVAVNLPVSNAQPQPRPDKPIFLTVKSDLNLALGNDEIARASLQPALDQQSGNDREQRVFLRADGAVAYRDLMEVMNSAAQRGLPQGSARRAGRYGTSIWRGSAGITTHNAASGDAVSHRNDHAAAPIRNSSVAPLLRWTAAAAVVVGAHAAGVWIALHWKPAQAAPHGGAVMLINLEPIPVAPEAEQKELPPGPEMTQAETEPEPEPIPEPDIKMPELPQQENAEAIVAQPPKPTPEEKPPEPKKRETEKKPVEPKKKKVVQTTAPAASANQSAHASAPALGTNSGARSDWNSRVMAALNRSKRSPPGAAMGTARVAFVVDRSGQVTSVRLSGSSGDSGLDQEAVALVQRASPLPAPPPEVGGSAIALSVPVRFSR